MTKILQIIPCTIPLWAKYQDKGQPCFTNQIICLALVEDEDGERIIGGVDVCETELSLVESSANFIGYSNKPEPEPATAPLP